MSAHPGLLAASTAAALVGLAALTTAVYPDARYDATTGPLAAGGLAGAWMVGTLATGRLVGRRRGGAR